MHVMEQPNRGLELQISKGVGEGEEGGARLKEECVGGKSVKSEWILTVLTTGEGKRAVTGLDR